MDKFITFVSDNYIWFLVITIFLIFALIGYIYDNKRSKTDYIRKNDNLVQEEEIELPEGKSINDLVNNTNNNENVIDNNDIKGFFVK